MKIYFAGSITGGRDFINIYKIIADLLEKKGILLTKYVADEKITEKGEFPFSPKTIFNRDINWLKEADLIVAEVSIPSLGVGYEIASALCFKKKVVCLYNLNSKFKLSALIDGNPHITLFKYKNIEELINYLDKLLKNN